MKRTDFDGAWRELSEEVILGMKEWRLQHPKATFAEIERALDAVLAELRPLVAAQPEQSELGKAPAYLEKREAQLDYPAFQAQDWPIGSGAVESANKVVVEARLKGAGMRWAEAHVNPMLALRNIVCSDRWDEAWPQFATRLRQQVAQGRRVRQQQRLGRSRPNPDTDTSAHAQRANEPTVAGPLPTSTQAAKPITVAGAGSERIPYRPAPNHPWRRSPIGRARFQPAGAVSQPKLRRALMAEWQNFR